jgi:protein O-GlcNAc transferase
MNNALLADAVRLHHAGNLAEAARRYTALLQSDPHHFHALYFLGYIHFQQSQFEEAERLIGEAVKINPSSPDAFYNRGCALQHLQRPGEALSAFDAALALKPDYDEALTNRGVALLALNRYPEAIASFDRALILRPRDPEALSNRATAYFEIRRYADAAADYGTLSAVAPDFPYTKGNLALARAYCCDWRLSEQDRAMLTSDIRRGKSAIPPHGSVLLLDNPADQLACARHWASEHPPGTVPGLWQGKRYRHERIRLAYVSADFSAHATAFLIAGVIEHHDRKGFETNVISFGTDDGSEMRTRLTRGCDRFVDAAALSDAEIAGMLHRMEIDIAIDLKGFTQNSRPGIFARRPAPIQVSYLAHPGTMGADFIDYIFADETVIPEDDQRYYSEKVVYLPYTYQANDSQRRIAQRVPARADAGLPSGAFVFCCFNNSFKITPAIFEVWMRLLRRRENSVLWLLEDNQTAVANLQREAKARGIDARRLVFAPRVAPEDHLARHHLADLFLDTTPCCAHTTASDALWAGLPVLTLPGNTFAGRVAASLLRAAGMPELIASSLENYESMAVALADDAASLGQTRAKLAKNRQTHPLFDTARFTRHLEAAYRGAWQRYERGEPPAGFAIAHSE